jgi:hypothetical protein
MKQTIKLLFLDPSRYSAARLYRVFEKLPIIIVYEMGCNNAYIVDTGIEVKKPERSKK